MMHAAENGNVALPRESLILVTGAAGFIGAHVVNEALKAGYRVRGTSPSKEKAQYTKQIFKHDPNYSTAIVSNMEHEGACDDAVNGCDAEPLGMLRGDGKSRYLDRRSSWAPHRLQLVSYLLGVHWVARSNRHKSRRS